MHFMDWCKRYNQNPQSVLRMMMKNFDYDPEFPGEISMRATIRLRVKGYDRFQDPVY